MFVALLVAKRQKLEPSLGWTKVEKAVDHATKWDDPRYSRDELLGPIHAALLVEKGE